MVGPGTAPFFTGGPIPVGLSGTYFFDFEEQRRTLIQFLHRRTHGRVGVAGSARAGKTSLVNAACLEVAQEPALLNCAKVWPASRRAFYAYLAEALGGRIAGADRPPSEAYHQMQLPRRKETPLLVLENVHALEEIDADLAGELPVLSARIPGPMIITGTPAAVEPVAEQTVRLGPFQAAVMAEFLRRRFASAGLQVADEAIGRFHEYTQDVPHALQLLGQAVWESLRGANERLVRAEHVDEALTQLVDRLPSAMLASYAGIRGMMRDVFVAMCLNDVTSPTEIAKRLDLDAKNVVVLLSRLATHHEVVERFERGRYRVTDPMLKHYVRKEWSSPLVR